MVIQLINLSQLAGTVQVGEDLGMGGGLTSITLKHQLWVKEIL